MLPSFAFTILAALGMGLAIGIERQFGQHPAGLRTHALVSVGTAMFVSLAGMVEHLDSPTRIPAQVVCGIGFLGGGVILREGFTVKGMTTAATLWCSAAVGTLAGAGYAREALLATAVVLTTNLMLHPVSRWIDGLVKNKSAVETSYRFRVVCQSSDERTIRTALMQQVNAQSNMLVQAIATKATEQSDRLSVVAEISANVRNDHAIQDVLSAINAEPRIFAASWERLR